MQAAAQNILILEPDRASAVRLVRALKRIGPFNVSVMPSVRDACLQLMQHPHDLAFIPVTEGAKIVRSFRAVQPDLRLILMTPTSDYEVPETYSGSVQAVLIKPLMDVELTAVLEVALEQPFVVDTAVTKQLKKELVPLDKDILQQALEQVALNRLIQTAVFAHNSTLLSYAGELKETEAATVAIHVGNRWQANTPSRIQFFRLPARAGDLLLYSRQVLPNYLLTMVAAPETPMAELRAHSAPLVVSLKKIVLGQTAPLSQQGIRDETTDGRNTFAIVWRPIRPLPHSLIIPLRRALERIAITNACVLAHVHVQPELVHLLVNCPPDKDSAWAAYTLKNGAEQKIQQQFGVAAQLWDMGYFAKKSKEPLSQEEINIFLERAKKRDA